MPLPQWWQRAVLEARRIIETGNRILVSSRSFWSKFSFPALEDRRTIVREATSLNVIASEIEQGSISGTIAEALTDAGFPTTQDEGGLTGGNMATVYAVGEYGPGRENRRAFRMTISFDESLGGLSQAIQDRIDELGEQYGLGSGRLMEGTLVIY